jgi:hypothetical protein
LHLVAIKEPIHLIIDSTGLSIVGEGEWAAAKYGGRGKRAWKKLHLGVDRSGVIVAEVLTDGNIDDAKTALDLIDEVEGDITLWISEDAISLGVVRISTSICIGSQWISPSISSSTAQACSSLAKESGPPPVEEGVGLSSASPSGEHLLQIQDDHWPRTSCSSPTGTGSRSDHCLQRSESGDGARQA